MNLEQIKKERERFSTIERLVSERNNWNYFLKAEEQISFTLSASNRGYGYGIPICFKNNEDCAKFFQAKINEINKELQLLGYSEDGK